ncbi:hypothetical protein B0H13DRAFT_1880296 [Mycena leptocephala]|nr:hypothetical protein B0H13DRAFT_1880296 [Mycena leptocephala]
MTTDILVLNVGFTGVLVAEALAHHRDRSKFTFAIAGRSQQKLEALASSPSLNGVKTFCVDISIQMNSKRLCPNSNYDNSTVPIYKQPLPPLAMDLRKTFVSRGTAVSGIRMLRDVPRDLFWKSLKPFSLSPAVSSRNGSINHAPLRLATSCKYHCKQYRGCKSYMGLVTNEQFRRCLRRRIQIQEFLVASSAAVARVSTVVSLALALLLIYIPPGSLAYWMGGGSRIYESDIQDLESGYLSATNITLSVPSAHDPTVHCAKTVFKSIGGDGGYMGSAEDVHISVRLGEGLEQSNTRCCIFSVASCNFLLGPTEDGKLKAQAEHIGPPWTTTSTTALEHLNRAAGTSTLTADISYPGETVHW